MNSYLKSLLMTGVLFCVALCIAMEAPAQQISSFEALRKMADETGDERFQEGVRIIEESYQPTETKSYIRAEVKNEAGAWVAIPLGMTEC